MPLNEPTAVSEVRRRIELPAVAVDVLEHKNLYLLVTAVSDTFVGMGSRTPGALQLSDVEVHLPVVG
jgi:ABC-2 type transport system ATP-binding protein